MTVAWMTVKSAPLREFRGITTTGASSVACAWPVTRRV